MIKQKSRKNYYYNHLITFENDTKRTRATIKEIIGSKKSWGTLFPKWLVVHDLEIFDEKARVRNSNKFFSEIGPKLASEIRYSLISSAHFLHGDY